MKNILGRITAEHTAEEKINNLEDLAKVNTKKEGENEERKRTRYM